MPVVEERGLRIVAPDGWRVVQTEGPLALVPKDGDAAVQISLFLKPEDKHATPTEKDALRVVHAAAHKMTGGDVRSREQAVAEELPPRIRVVEAEAWPVGDSMCAWLDLAAPGEEAGMSAGQHMAVGCREWEDARVLLTWIADPARAHHDAEVRAIFTSIERS